MTEPSKLEMLGDPAAACVDGSCPVEPAAHETDGSEDAGTAARQTDDQWIGRGDFGRRTLSRPADPALTTELAERAPDATGDLSE